MLIPIQLDALDAWQLQGLLCDEFPTIESALKHLVFRAVEGVNRPGSWERGWLDQVFPIVREPEGSQNIAHVTAWHRQRTVGDPEKYPVGWIGIVERGDGVILFEAEPEATKEAALLFAEEWLVAHPQYQPVEEALEEMLLRDIRCAIPDDDMEAR